MDNKRLNEFKGLTTIKRKELANPNLLLHNTPEVIQMQNCLSERKNISLTKRQREIVDLASAEVMDYLITRVKNVKPEEWLSLMKSITFLAIAAVKKDKALMLIHLQAIGSFLMKHFMPDFVYNSNIIVFTKTGDKIDFKLK